ncbi:enoyl-CoA delta isomerase 1, mitochondrial-like [Polyodon spathula]|uniref:enoyl-CoA delta isomerase 1, mitochondrial-like n=1 Tax=Polyodon spathula TaxID=7913 RepID=UPI001B7E35DC|nr:enoyl-CoA delta isomerase 1, mitochondrial-like [Polyodon spathula]
MVSEFTSEERAETSRRLQHALAWRLSRLGVHSRLGGLQCLQPCLLPHQRSASTGSKILVEMDDSTEKALPKIFSAGLDIMEMYGKSPEHCGEFWKAVQEMWLRLYGSSMITVAAINGSSPAGGCLMALACDYRIMAENPKYSIGLNETQLGIVAPFWFKDTLLNTVGNRAAELSLQLGLLYSAPDALRTGLVDLLVPEDKVLSTASQTMTQWLAIPDHARQITKSMMRKPTVDRLLASREPDVKNFVSFITKDSIQKSLQVYMERLKHRKP